MAAANDRVKLDALTGLRYWAAFAIFVHHVLGASLNDFMTRLESKVPRPDLGSIGMPLFFTLSGFLMYYNYFGKFEKNFRGTLRDFLVARLARIYPLYLFALLLSFSFMGNFFHDVRDRPHDAFYCLATGLTLTQSWFHDLVFQDYLWPRMLSYGYLGVSWSVSVEVFFYVTFPFICVPLLKRMTTIPRILGTASVVYLAYVALDVYVSQRSSAGRAGLNGLFELSLAKWFLYVSPYARYGEFLWGCLAGALFAKLQSREITPRETLIGRLVLWGSIGLLIAQSLPTCSLQRNWAWYCLKMNIGNAPVCVAIIFCLARYESGLQRFLSRPLLVLLGESSYGIYLLHPLVQSFYQFQAMGESDMHDGYVIFYNHLAMAAVLHVFCLGTFQFIETPARIALRNWLGRRKDRPEPGEPAVSLPIVRAGQTAAAGDDDAVHRRAA